MTSHKTYTALYDPIYLFNVPPKTFRNEMLSMAALFFGLSFLLNGFTDMIIAMAAALLACLVSFFMIHSRLSSKYKRRGFWWKEEERFYSLIPYGKLHRKGAAALEEEDI